jgi:hypothetical protein
MTGTNHFYSVRSALNYYKPQGLDMKDILAKIEAKEIVIGRPEHKVIPIKLSNGRYFLLD